MIRRRVTSVVTAVSMATAALLANASLPGVAGAFAASDRSTTQCWKLSTNPAGIVTVLSTASGTDCAIHLSLPVATQTFAPNASISVSWDAQLLDEEHTKNTLKMPLPPKPSRSLRTSARGDNRPTQISASFVRSCPSMDDCDPTTVITFQTDVQRANFSESNHTASFVSTDELVFAEPGTYAVAAQITVLDQDDAFIKYVYMTHQQLEVAWPVPETGVVHCRLTVEDRADDDAPDASPCGVRLQLEAIPVAAPGETIAVSWTASLSSSLAAAVGDKYDVKTRVKVCASLQDCDVYSTGDALVSSVSTGSYSFADHDSETFTAKDVTLPSSAGWYTAFLHMEMEDTAGLWRYDVTYYFDVFASTEDIASAVTNDSDYEMDGTTYYCWNTLASSDDLQATSGNVAAAAEMEDCPYALTFTLNKEHVDVNQVMTAEWMISPRQQYSLTSFPNVNLTAVYDNATEAMATLPVMQVYACPASESSSSGACTPYSTDKTVLYTAPAQNLTDAGSTKGSANKLVLTTAGVYTVMARASLPNGAGRVDLASFMTVTVGSARTMDSRSEGSSSTGMIVGIIVGLLILLLVGVLLLLRRRRNQQERRLAAEKSVVPRPPSPTFSTSSRAPMPRPSSDFLDTGSFSLAPAQNSPVEGLTRINHSDSLSFDPFGTESESASLSSRASFVPYQGADHSS